MILCEASINYFGITLNIVMCPELPDPSNGAVVVSGLTVGSTASYTCDAGFELSENILRMCEVDGIWSGSEPLCESGTHSLVDSI